MKKFFHKLRFNDLDEKMRLKLSTTGLGIVQYNLKGNGWNHSLFENSAKNPPNC